MTLLQNYRAFVLKRYVMLLCILASLVDIFVETHVMLRFGFTCWSHAIICQRF